MYISTIASARALSKALVTLEDFDGEDPGSVPWHFEHDLCHPGDQAPAVAAGALLAFFVVGGTQPFGHLGFQEFVGHNLHDVFD